MSTNHRHYVHLCTISNDEFVKVTSMQQCQSIHQQQLKHIQFKALSGELQVQYLRCELLQCVQLLVIIHFFYDVSLWSVGSIAQCDVLILRGPQTPLLYLPSISFALIPSSSGQYK